MSDRRELIWYFLKLGTIGFGGPAALVGYMRRDLVEERHLVDESTYNMSIALAQIMPGPLAAQAAMAIGYFRCGLVGATLVGLAFILPSFLMVLGLGAGYVAFGGMAWMQAMFYAVGPAVIAVIAIAAHRLARGTNKRDPLLWAVFGVMFVVTAWTGTELAPLFIFAGWIVLMSGAWPGTGRAVLLTGASLVAAILVAGVEYAFDRTGGTAAGQPVLLEILVFFAKAGAFVFGSGLAIVPFLQQGVVHDLGWLNDNQFLDAVAVALITPGPVVITVAFIGYLVAGVAGATVAAIGIFLPTYFFTIVPAPWFKRHRDNLQLRAFAAGATAAASGAIAGAVVVLGLRAIVDGPTVIVAVVSLVLMLRFRVAEPLVVVGAGIVGLLLAMR
jgi:chromate transporter